MIINSIQRRDTVRVHCRLQSKTMTHLDNRCIENHMTRTEVIIQALTELTHQLQTTPPTHNLHKSCLERLKRTKTNHTTEIQLKLPRVIIEYLRFNQYNITTTISIALQQWKTDFTPA